MVHIYRIWAVADQIIRFLVFPIFLFLSLFSSAQSGFENSDYFYPEARNYVIYQTVSEIKIDGKPDEISWNHADWSEDFQDIEGDIKPIPTFRTRIKMLWDESNLYIFAELEEPHIWAYYGNRDQIIYHENDFEVFIDPDRDGHNYFEFELNARNTLFDLFMPKPYRDGGRAKMNWNANGFKSAVSVQGTINEPSDFDEKWTIEMAIPFSSLFIQDEKKIPVNNQFWKINFSRVQWQTEINNGKYQKVKNENSNQFLDENNWVWSQQGLINMHFPERWGLAMFSANPVNGEKTVFQMPKEEVLRKYIWQVYYLQKDFKKVYGEYAETLSLLNLKSNPKIENGESLDLKLESEKNGFRAILEDGKGLLLSVDQDGLFKIIYK